MSIVSCIGLYLRMWYNMAAAVSTLMCGTVGVRHSTSVAKILEWGSVRKQAVSQVIYYRVYYARY